MVSPQLTLLNYELGVSMEIETSVFGDSIVLVLIQFVAIGVIELLRL